MPNGTQDVDCQTLLAQDLKPGDLISVDYIKCLLDKLLELEVKVGAPAGPRTVPNVFGQTLAQTRSLFSQPVVGLRVGKVFDPLGQAVNPDLSASATRIVIGQMPDAGTRVQTNSKVDLLLSAVAQDTGGDGGGGVGATGFIDVNYQNSPRGMNVVVGDTDGFPHVFAVLNNTNQELTINVSAVVTAASGNWTESVEILDNETSDPISSLTLDQPTGPTPTRGDIRVVVTPPEDAVVGQSCTLTVSANVPAPHNKTAQESVTLLVSEEEGEAVLRTVVFDNFQPPDNLGNVEPEQVLSFIADFRYSAKEEPLEGNFTVSVEVVASPAGTTSEWPVLFLDDPPTESSGGVFSTPITLAAGATSATRVTAQVRAPLTRSATTAKTADVIIRISSIDLPEVISSEQPAVTITLAAQPPT